LAGGQSELPQDQCQAQAKRSQLHLPLLRPDGRPAQRDSGFVYGDYNDLDPANPKIFAYTRAIGADKYLVVLNFSTDALTYKLPGATKAGDLVISNLGKTTASGDTLHLNGWEARVYRY
jgi:hypothetical protein